MSRQWHEMAERQQAIEEALVNASRLLDLASARRC
jgi:hypothetical protein